MEEAFKFQTSFKVRIGDINYGGHMGNDKYLLLFHDARIQFLEAFGFSEKDIGDGIALIMSKAHIDFKSDVFLGDELNVGVRVTNIEVFRFTIEYQVEKNSDKKVVAAGHTLMVPFDYQKRKICKIPEEFKTKFMGRN